MSPKNNKKQVNIAELDTFLAKPTFTVKEESDIWCKFGNLIGTGQYYLYRNGNRATITSRGVQYHYVVLQMDDKNHNVHYQKIVNSNPQEVWTDKAYEWRKEYWSQEAGKWLRTADLPPRPVYTPEEDAISIIESVVMSTWKSYKKTLDFDDGQSNLFLEQTDFCYTYVGNDRQWHAFYPNIEKLVAYAEKFNKIDFLEFLKSEECYWHRELWSI